jgi:Ca2+:H+ antiporter
VVGGLTRRDGVELGVGALLLAAAAAARYATDTAVLQFVMAALAIAALARLVGGATEQLGARLGAASAGTVQSALGNLPELFIALFALHDGLVDVVKSALIGSVLANSLLVLGLAFTAGGLRNGVQEFHGERARMIATLSMLAAATLAIPTFAHDLHTSAAQHEQALSLICAGVLLVVFLLTLRGFLTEAEPGEELLIPPRWPLGTTVGVLGFTAVAAAVTSDWFVSALDPATRTLHMSHAFTGLVVVAIAGNAVENVIGIQLALRNQPDFAISVVINSSLQVALALTPAVVFLSLFFTAHLTLVFPTLLAVVLLLGAVLAGIVVYDGRSTWEEGVVLVGLYVVVAASFWWGT